MPLPALSADDLVALMAALEASCYTGRVQVTLDFNRGGVSRLQVAEVVPLDACSIQGRVSAL